MEAIIAQDQARQAALQAAVEARTKAEDASRALKISLERERAAHLELQQAFAPLKATGVDPTTVPALLEAFSRIGRLAGKAVA